MRYALALVIIFAGWHIGSNAIKTVEEITNQRNAQLCKVDPSLCQSTK